MKEDIERLKKEIADLEAEERQKIELRKLKEKKFNLSPAGKILNFIRKLGR